MLFNNLVIVHYCIRQFKSSITLCSEKPTPKTPGCPSLLPAAAQHLTTPAAPRQQWRPTRGTAQPQIPLSGFTFSRGLSQPHRFYLKLITSLGFNHIRGVKQPALIRLRLITPTRPCSTNSRDTQLLNGPRSSQGHGGLL